MTKIKLGDRVIFKQEAYTKNGVITEATGGTVIERPTDAVFNSTYSIYVRINDNEVERPLWQVANAEYIEIDYYTKFIEKYL